MPASRRRLPTFWFVKTLWMPPPFQGPDGPLKPRPNVSISSS